MQMFIKSFCQLKGAFESRLFSAMQKAIIIFAALQAFLWRSLGAIGWHALRPV